MATRQDETEWKPKIGKAFGAADLSVGVYKALSSKLWIKAI